MFCSPPSFRRFSTDHAVIPRSFHRKATLRLATGLVLLIGLVALVGQIARAEDGRVLTIPEILALPDSSAVGGMPVVTRGILTYHEPGHRMAFLQDQSAAIYVHVAGKQDVSPGDFVEVRGFLDPGLNGRNIRGPDFDTSPLIRRLSEGSHPEPLRLPSLDGIEHQTGARWVRASIKVKAIALEGDRARITLEEQPHIPVFIAGVTRPSMVPNHLAGLSVDVDGVIADSPISEKPLVMQRQILTPGLKFVHIPPGEIEKQFDLPESGLSDLRWLQEREGPEIRARVSGVVTWLKPGEGFFIQRGTMAAWIQSTSHLVPDVGQFVECAGRPSSYQGSGILNAAIWRGLSTAHGPEEATPFAPGQLEADTTQGRLTRIDGTLVEMFRSPSEDLAILQMGSEIIFSHLSASADSERLPQLEKGSGVALTGVFLNRPSPALSAADAQGSYHLLVRSARDLRVLSAPPFWDTRRLVMLLAALVATALLAGIWVLALRRKVRKQESIIRMTIAKQVIEEERVRIAREWHDSFEQHFAGLTMLLDATAAVVPAESQASSMLERAARMADHSRSEARQAIWDLRASAIKSHVPFATELEESLHHSWPEDAGCELRVDCRERTEILPRSVTLHLLRIAQEAVTNALKHARCTTIEVIWETQPRGLALTVVDDGAGLPAATNDQASQEGHFGLLGMRERALRLHGFLEILSPPHNRASGTAVRITIPTPSRES
jgi:signal transduction histidine kinase